MVDVADQGRRPLVRIDDERRPPAKESISVCPGVGLRRPAESRAAGTIVTLFDEWGPVLEVWEGHATDPELRFRGSSGGVSSALALYAIECVGMHGLLHTAGRPDVPWENFVYYRRRLGEYIERFQSAD